MIAISTLRCGAPATQTRLRVLLMPAAFQRLEEFQRAGFDDAARRADVQLLLASPAMTHLTDRQWLAPLQELIERERADGRPLWLGGISLGGFMALRCAADYPLGHDGLCLLAPYLGSRLIARELAPGFSHWQPGELAQDDDERRIWRHVQRLRRAPRPLFLGFGAEDRFADTLQLLARQLPSCTHVVPGGHDWSVWRQLWDNFLQRHVVPHEACLK